METVTIRELRNCGGEVVDRVEGGVHVTVTRDGRPVAELRPLRPRGTAAATLLARWSRLPAVDADAFLDTSALLEHNRLSDPTHLPNLALISAVTLAELTVGLLAASDGTERARRLAHLQQPVVRTIPAPSQRRIATGV